MPDRLPTRPAPRLAYARPPLASPANDAPTTSNLRAPAIDLADLLRIPLLGKIS